MSAPAGTALITGASSGIGAVYAERLAGRGHDLILVARNVERLDALAGLLRTRHGVHVRTVSADLGTPAGVTTVEAVLRSDESITLLVNNAGFGSTAPLLQSDPASMTQMIDVNVTALTRLTQAIAPGFVARGGGTIINIASIVAIGPELLNGVYGATKAYVLALSQSLHKELAAHGVRVQVVLPGATATRFWDIAGLPVEHLPEAWVMSASDLVDAALIGLDRGEFATLPSLMDESEYTAWEAARQSMLGHLSNASPAERYRLTDWG